MVKKKPPHEGEADLFDGSVLERIDLKSFGAIQVVTRCRASLVCANISR